MKSIMKIELSRAFKSSGFKLSLLVGCIIAIAHCATMVFPYTFQLKEYVSLNLPMMYPGWLFSNWIGGNTNTMYSFLYFLIIPILAALPFADSFFTDAKGGFIQNLCIRVNKRHYYIAKYSSTFLSGGVAVVTPLLLNFFLSCLLLPSMKPEVASSDTLIGEMSTFPHLYFSHPFVYVFVFMLIIFVFCGIFSTLSLLASYHVGYRFLVLIAPFLIYLFIMALFNLVGLENWQPTNFLHPAYHQDSLLAILVESAILLVITVLGFVVRGVKKDIY